MGCVVAVVAVASDHHFVFDDVLDVDSPVVLLELLFLSEPDDDGVVAAGGDGNVMFRHFGFVPVA